MERILVPAALFFLLSIGLAMATTCTVRDNGCNVDEIPVFSVAYSSNAHAADYLYYDKKVCCPNTTSSNIRAACNSDESEVMSFYKLDNSHTAVKDYSTAYKLCIKFNNFLNCVIKSSCSASDICVASIAYQTNSHIGDCNTYSNKICCGELVVNVEAGGPYVKLITLPTILIVGNVTFNGEAVAYANVSIKIYDGGTLKESRNTVSSSTGKFSTTFTNLDISTYTVSVSANYSLASTSGSDTFKVTESLSGCDEKTVSLSGTALDYMTGLPISSGTVKIAIRENGDEFSTSFTNGRWVISFASCLVQGRKYNAVVQITDSSTGRISWGETQFIAS